MSTGVDTYETRPPLDRDGFDYKPMSPLAPISLVLGLCSILSLITILGMAICLIGLILGALCLIQIHRADGGLSGKWVARLGTFLCLVFLIGSGSWHSYVIATEVPEGFRRVSFSQNVAQKQLVVQAEQVLVHPDVAALDGKKIFIKGYIYPTGQETGIVNFVLVKDNQQCCFGGQPQITDMIEVFLQDGLSAKYYQGLVSVGGVFRINNPSSQSSLSPVYRIDGMHFHSPARSSF